MDLKYTHNLKIIFYKDGKITNDDKIKNILTTTIDYLNKDMNLPSIRDMNDLIIRVKWDYIELNEIQKMFLGNYFYNTIYGFDDIILEHTKKTLGNIKLEKGEKIVFHISKFLMKKEFLLDSMGIAE